MTRESDSRGGIADTGPPYASIALVVFVVVAFQLPIFDRWFSSMDEGHVLLFSDLIAKGGDLYRDATLYPLPGAFYLLAQFFKLFSASILLTRWIVLVEFTIFVVGIFLLMRRLASPAAAFASVLAMLVYRIFSFPHWQVYSYSSTALLVILLALASELRFLETRRNRWLWLSGLLFGFAVYCKQDYGAAALLAMSLLLVVGLRATGGPGRTAVGASLAIFVGAGALVGSIVGAYFFAHGLLGELVQQTVVNHVRGIGAFEYTSYPPLFPFFAQEPAIRTPAGLFAFFPGIVSTVDLEALRQNVVFRETFLYDAALKLFYWGPYAFVAAASFRLWRRRRELASNESLPRYLRELALVAFAAAFVLLTTVNRPQDFLHLAVLYWPFLCLAVLYAMEALRLLARRRTLALLLASAIALPAIPLLGYSGRAYLRLRTQNHRLIPGARAGIYAKPSEVELIREVTAFMQAHAEPDETVAVLPYFPMLHFLADRRGPHRSAYIVWPFPEYEDRDRRIIRALEREGTRAVVYNFTQFLTFPPMREFAPELYAHLVEHFELQEVFSYDSAGFMLAGLVREDEATREGISLLDAAARETDVWIESDEGPPRALSPEEGALVARRGLWPFRPALALRPSSGARRTVFGIPLDALGARDGDVVRTAIGVHPERWFVMPAYRAHFELALAPDPRDRPGGGARRVLFEKTLDPHLDLADRGWTEVEVPLAGLSSGGLRLEFSVEVNAAAGESQWVGGWAEPRLVPVSRASPGPVVAD